MTCGIDGCVRPHGHLGPHLEAYPAGYPGPGPGGTPSSASDLVKAIRALASELATLNNVIEFELGSEPKGGADDFDRLFAESGDDVEAERLRTGTEPGPAWWARWGWDARGKHL